MYRTLLAEGSSPHLSPAPAPTPRAEALDAPPSLSSAEALTEEGGGASERATLATSLGVAEEGEGAAERTSWDGAPEDGECAGERVNSGVLGAAPGPGVGDCSRATGEGAAERTKSGLELAGPRSGEGDSTRSNTTRGTGDGACASRACASNSSSYKPTMMKRVGGLFGLGEGVRGSVLGESVDFVERVRELDWEWWLCMLGRVQRRELLGVGDGGGGGGGGGVSMVVGVCEGRCSGCVEWEALSLL